MAEPLGVGLVGAGGFGEFCSAAFQQMREVRLVAVADLVEERAAVCAPPDAKVYTRYAALLSDPAVDIVAINTPPHLHAAMAVELPPRASTCSRKAAGNLNDGRAGRVLRRRERAFC